MSFQALRRATLQANALSTDRFAEDVTIVTRNQSRATVRAKIEYDQRLPRKPNGKPSAIAHTDSVQRIRVMVSRETDWDGSGIANTPDIGTNLIRSSTVDSDTRPWIFAGEIIAQGDLFATYIFERAKTAYQDRRHPQQ